MARTSTVKAIALLLVLSWTSCAGAASFADCETCPALEAISGGSFEMGDENWADATPVRTVTLQAFAIGKHEVTQAQWRAVMGGNPSKATGCGDACPVENVSWHEVQDFLQRLGARTGKSYRLPSEAEWEYACRAGSRNAYCGGDDRAILTWFGKAGTQLHRVGKKAANAWGLHDMSGNVWEWVQDCSHPNFAGAPSDGSAWTESGCKSRVIRGGSWWGRAASRMGLTPGYRAGDIGFRVARDAAAH